MAKKVAKKVAKEVIERKLSKEVAEKYKMKTIRAGKYNFQDFGEIDLRTISVEKADALYEKEFPYLELVKKPETKESE